VITLQKVRNSWLKLRIAYHRHKAEAYNEPVPSRSVKRDDYAIWMRNMAMRHAQRMHELTHRLDSPRS
jgi:hypothetical protein